MRAWVLETSYGRVDAQPELATEGNTMRYYRVSVVMKRQSQDQSQGVVPTKSMQLCNNKQSSQNRHDQYQHK